MNPKRGLARKALSAALSALLVALSVAVPLIGRADLDHREQWESHHQHGVCDTGHDHTICTSVGANLSMPATAVAYQPALVVVSTGRSPGLTAAARHGLRLGHPTRAPPSV